MAVKKTNKTVEAPKTIEQIREVLIAKKQDLMEARRGHKLGELTNPRVLTVTRKEIARLKTAIRADEIANRPVKAEAKEKK